MATRGTPLPARTLTLLLRLRAQGWSIRSCARALHISPTTVWKYASPLARARRLAA